MQQHLSRNLEIHIGEWVTYQAIIDCKLRQSLEPENKVENMSDQAFFETSIFRTSDAPYLETVKPALLRLQIFRNEDAMHDQLRAACRYADIRRTIAKNIQSDQESLFDLFLESANVPMRGYHPFKIASKCQHLIQAFIADGFCTRIQGGFVWTEAFYAQAAKYGYDTPTTEMARYATLAKEISSTLHESLTKLAEDNQKIWAVKILKDATNWDLKTTKLFLEDYLFPKIWGPSRDQLFLPWNGPI